MATKKPVKASSSQSSGAKKKQAKRGDTSVKSQSPPARRFRMVMVMDERGKKRMVKLYE